MTLPLYLYLLWRQPSGNALSWSRIRGLKREFRENRPMLIHFLSVPVTLALLTAAYNFARFHSIFDFGYIHIPEVRDEPWYEHGLFSIQAIPWNIYTMLFQGFESISSYPYLQPNGFGCSIFLASPFLCLLFRQSGRYKVVAWVAITLLTLVLWCHGNPEAGVFVSLCDDSPSLDVSPADRQRRENNRQRDFPFAVSVAINALAMWHFFGPTKSNRSKKIVICDQ
jgi:hypothetical protein